MPLTAAEKFAGLSPEEQERVVSALAEQYVGTNLSPEPDEAETSADDELDGDLSELVDFYDETLPLRYRGVTYTLHAADVATGLLCQQVWSSGVAGRVGAADAAAKRDKAEASAAAVLDDNTQEALWVRLLGGDQTDPGYRADWDVFAALQAARAPWRLIEHMGTTAFLWCVENRAAALGFWKAGDSPKAAPATPPAREPQDHRTPKAGQATTTRKRASGSSTTPQKFAATGGAKSGGTGA